MNLETLSHIFGIGGFLVGIFTIFLAYRKRLLQTGFTNFQEQYRIEMDDFKKYIRNDINMFREMMNENDARHTKSLETIATYYKSTSDEVTKQSNVCKLIQKGNSINKKYSDDWNVNLKNELDDVQRDVTQMKRDIERIRSVINGKK